MFDPKQKARGWSAILYPENMVEDWQSRIADTYQLPGVYIIHDKDLDKDKDCRKVHVHCMLIWGNTTTAKAALSVFNLLSAPGKRCASTCEPIINVRYLYNYFIHDTDTARSDAKYQYPAFDRICFNNFDIGVFEQLSQAEKNVIAIDIAKAIMDNRFTNYMDCFAYVLNYEDSNYLDVFRANTNFFYRLCEGNYHKAVRSAVYSDYSLLKD